MPSSTRATKKPTKARKRRYLKAQERLERDCRQAQHAAKVVEQALEELGLPTDLVAEPTSQVGTLRLTWTDNSGGNASYRVYRSSVASGAGNGASNGHYYLVDPVDLQCIAGTCEASLPTSSTVT